MLSKENARALLDDLENKKVFECSWDADCDVCGRHIFEGDQFYFYGNKQKMCATTYSELINELEGIAE